MAAAIATRLILNTKNFSKGIKGARKGLGMLGGALGKVGGIIAKFGLALVAATAGFAAIIMRSAGYIDRLGKVSKVTGVATDTLQKFGYAAEQAGVTSDNAGLAMRRFSRRLGEAQKETGELLPALRRLGIDVKDASGRFKTAEEVLFEFADGIVKTEGASARLALAFKAFDSEGAELVGTLEKGSAGLKEMFDEAQALGFVLDEKTIKGVEKFNDSLNSLKRMVGGVINRITGELAPALDEFVNHLITTTKESAKAVGGFENLGKVLKDKMLSVVKVISRAFFEMYRAIVFIVNGAIKLLQKFGVVNEVQAIQDRIDELRAETKKPLFMAWDPRDVVGVFHKWLGNYQELIDEFGSFEIITMKDYERAIEILEKLKAKTLAETGGFEMDLIKMPGMEEWDAWIAGIDKFTEKGKESAKVIEEVVATGAKGTLHFLDSVLDGIFGKKRVDEYFGKTEEYAEKAVLGIGDFIAITFDLLKESSSEFFKEVREKMAAAGVGEFMKTLSDGFVKAGQLLETALTDAVLTGKLSFSSLADHIKQVLAKALIQKFITSKILGFFNLEHGGPAKAGQPYVVGEAGPELFIPKQSGTVIPNDEMTSGASGYGQGGGPTTVNYTIVANDPLSFKNMIARDPEFIYNVTQAGARRQPA